MTQVRVVPMVRAFLLAATLASALPAGVALADDPPVATAPPYVVTAPDEPPVVTAPPVVVTTPDDYCNVVVIVDGPVYPDGSQGPGTTVFVPCGSDAVIPPLVIDAPAELGTVAAAPVVAARLGYVPEWVTLALGGAA